MTELRPKDRQRLGKATQALAAQQPDEALRLLNRIEKSRPRDLNVWFLKSAAYGRKGDMQGVMRCCKRILALNPQHSEALGNMANALIATGQYEDALDYYRQASSLDPHNPTILENYGKALWLSGQLGQAEELLRKALHANPHHAPAHAGLGEIYKETARFDDALNHYQKALQLDANIAVAHCGIGHLYSGLGGAWRAEEHFRQAIRIEPRFISAYAGLAAALRFLGRFEDGLEVCERAEQLEPGNPMVLSRKADIYEHQGDYERAYRVIANLRELNRLTPLAVTCFANICLKIDACDEALAMLSDFLVRSDLSRTDRYLLHYAFGRLLDRLKRYDEAFEHFQEANDLASVPCDQDRLRNETDEIIQSFSKASMVALPRARTGSTRPIFILGMPRSGTTLVEQILSSHSRVYGAGELHYLNDLAKIIRGKHPSAYTYAGGIHDISQEQVDSLAMQYLDRLNKVNADALYVTDKMPQNFLGIGLIALLFPEARIIHCKRNPLDNCLSIYFQNFIWSHSYSTDLANIAFYYREYERLMKHWREIIGIPVFTVQYEEMIDNQEAISRELVKYCGLDWEDGCLQFHKSRRDVATSSYEQVRNPIYKSSRARWKNYERYIGPLREALNM